VEYASRALTNTEQNYAQIEKKLLSILFALERFDSYVYLKHDVTVETDHKPLTAIHKKALSAAPKRLQRMLLRLQRYTYNLVFRPGTDLILADRRIQSQMANQTSCRDKQFGKNLQKS
jgi:hypothetical protein